jgi:acetoacetyl-CoA synthetase
MSALASSFPVRGQPAHTEDLLLHIWKRALRVPEIERDSNFFDLGGDSLLAVNLLLDVERQTGVSIPITAIYDAPTVAEMARLIASQTTRESACVVLLKPGTAQSPVFIVHGIGGTIVELAALGRKIRIPDAVYAIQARGLDGRDTPLTTIEDMADLYVAALRRIQPHGPYRLCGYSFGGLVAMEIARRLRAENEKVAALILVDAYAHPSTWPVLSRTKMRLRRAFHLFRQAVQRPPSQTLSRAIKRMRASLSEIGAPTGADSGARESARLHDWLLDQNPSLPLPLLRAREAGSAALRAYRPRSYAGPIIFLKAKHRDTEFPDDPERIWRRLAPKIVYRTIPGGHRTVVTEYAGTAAAMLTACLAWVPWEEEPSPVKAGVPSSLDIAGTFQSQTV